MCVSVKFTIGIVFCLFPAFFGLKVLGKFLIGDLKVLIALMNSLPSFFEPVITVKNNNTIKQIANVLNKNPIFNEDKLETR